MHEPQVPLSASFLRIVGAVTALLGVVVIFVGMVAFRDLWIMGAGLLVVIQGASLFAFGDIQASTRVIAYAVLERSAADELGDGIGHPVESPERWTVAFTGADGRLHVRTVTASSEEDARSKVESRGLTVTDVRRSDTGTDRRPSTGR